MTEVNINSTSIPHFDLRSNDEDIPNDASNVTVHPTVTAIKGVEGSRDFRGHMMARRRTGAPAHILRLESIKISNSVKYIGRHAFGECSSLTTIKIPSSVDHIDQYAFHNCVNLTSVDLPDAIEIDIGVFDGCSSLESITVPENCMKPGIFSRCTSLKHVKFLPSSSTLNNAVGPTAFSSCTSLTCINIPANVGLISAQSFQNCSSVLSLNLPSTLKYLYDGVFAGCSSLVSICIPDSTEIIPSFSMGGDDHPFIGCEALGQRVLDCPNYHEDTTTWLKQRFTNLPIHHACYFSRNDVTANIALKTLIQQQQDIAAFTATDAMLMTPLHTLASNPNASTELLKILKDARPEAASMKNVMHQTPLEMYLNIRGVEYDGFYEDGQLRPFIELLEMGMSWDVIEVILVLNDTSSMNTDVSISTTLERNDIIGGLSPFMYAGSLPNCKLEVVYGLAMAYPNLLFDLNMVN